MHILACFVLVLGLSWACLGLSWAVLGGLEGPNLISDDIFPFLTCFMGRPGLVLGCLGPVFGRLGCLWMSGTLFLRFGFILGPRIWFVAGYSWGYFRLFFFIFSATFGAIPKLFLVKVALKFGSFLRGPWRLSGAILGSFLAVLGLF